MQTLQVILIAIAVIVGFFIFKYLKPYFIKHDTTLLFTGGLGAGKTLHAVKTAIVLIRKNYIFKYFFVNKWRKFVNPIKEKHNNKPKNLAKPRQIKELRKIPKIYSNIPICYKLNPFSKKRYYSVKLTTEHLLCLDTINEYSIVLIDELPQLVNQFNWDSELVQKNLNEFITYFRHYYAGYFICTAQSESDVVVQIRRKLNNAIWCFHMKKYLFGLFYSVEMCDIMLSDQVSNMTTSQIEDNTKKHWGLFPPRWTYDTRCFSERVNNSLEKLKNKERYKKLKTNKIVRLQEYISPLDDETTKQQKIDQLERAYKLQRKVLTENEKNTLKRNN